MNTPKSESSGHLSEFAAHYRATLTRWEQQSVTLSLAYENCTAQLKTNNDRLQTLISRCDAITAHLNSLPSPEELVEHKRLREAAVRNTAVMEQYIGELQTLRSEYSRLQREYSELRSALQRR